MRNKQYGGYCERTLLTIDGGLNWFNIADLPEINDLAWAVVTDFVKADNSYVLTVRYTAKEGSLEYGTSDEYGYATYKLTDFFLDKIPQLFYFHNLVYFKNNPTSSGIFFIFLHLFF